MYVSSENGTQAMNCNRPSIAGWESFNYGIAGAVTAATVVKDAGAALSIYPNPVADRLTYTVPEGTGAHTVVVRDFTGNTVLNKAAGVADGENTLDTSDWKKGIYYISISDSTFRHTFKIVKE